MPLRAWIVTEGKQGMESQCLGLAEALGAAPELKRVRLRFPWRQVAPYVRFALDWAASPRGDLLRPPWPDLLICCGKASIAPSIAAHRQSRGQIYLIHIGDPAIDNSLFDLIISPRHDTRAHGPNVVPSTGSLHRVTPERLAAEAALHPRLEALPRPRLAVMIGGSSKLFRLTPRRTAAIADAVAGVVGAAGGSVMVTASRRTGAANEAVLHDRLGALGEVWGGTGANPYFAYLAYADAIAVTEDSVNMVSEAAATGKPVYVLKLDGGARKYDAFHRAMAEARVTRPLGSRLESWSYPPFDETAATAAEVRRRLIEAGRLPS